MSSLNQQGIYKHVTEKTVELIKYFIENKKHSVLFSTGFISPEAGQVGYLLNEWFNMGRSKEQRTRYKSFFANSRLEAIHGAIKIARGHLIRTRQQNTKDVLIYDPVQELLLTVDPLARGKDKALIPGVILLKTMEEVFNYFNEMANAPAALILPAYEDLTLENVESLFTLCYEKNILAILDDSRLNFKDSAAMVHRLSVLPNIIITGESLTEYEMPFAAFSTQDSIFMPMNNSQTSMLHTATFGGNRITLSRVRDFLMSNVADFGGSNSLISYFRQIEEDDWERSKAYSDYINPAIVRLYNRCGMNIHPITAQGATLTVKDGKKERKTIDCATGGAVAIRGHANPDVIPEVLEIHDRQENYWQKLSQMLSSKSGLPHVLPAVSGATAVEIAITMAMMANNQRTRIISFNGNFAGLTLLALTGSQDPSLRQPFFPLYFDVVYIDPLSRMAKELLKTELESQKVALVWLEIFQGQHCRPIPGELLEIISNYKEKGGYLIGVDEILTGMYRMGEFLAHKKTPLSPDIVTMGKGLSDGIFPFSAALVSSDVYQKALSANPDTVNYLQHLYVNQLGAHIALHVIEKLSSMEIEKHVAHVSQLLHTGLKEIVNHSPFLKKVAGDGLILNIQLEYYGSKLLKLFGKKNKVIANGFFHLFFHRIFQEKAKVLLFFDRCLPPVTITEEEVRSILVNLKKVLCGLSGRFFIKTRYPIYVLFKKYKKEKK